MDSTKVEIIKIWHLLGIFHSVDNAHRYKSGRRYRAMLNFSADAWEIVRYASYREQRGV